MFTVQSIPPDPLLSRFISRYVQRESQAWDAETVEPVVARPGAMLEFQFAEPYDIPAYDTDRRNPSASVTVIGPITRRRVRLIIRGRVQALAVLFRPLALYRLFGVPVHHLTDIGNDGQGVLGPEVSALHQQLGNEPAILKRASLLNAFFRDRLARRPPIDPVGRALRLLTVPGNNATASEISRKAGISPRQLERKSLCYAGVSPNVLTRISRFQNAVLIKSAGDTNWTEIAHVSGWYDQMHMIRDFRVFAGETPNRAMKQIAPEHLIRFCGI